MREERREEKEGIILRVISLSLRVISLSLKVISLIWSLL